MSIEWLIAKIEASLSWDTEGEAEVVRRERQEARAALAELREGLLRGAPH
jgi:hypothetical protein